MLSLGEARRRLLEGAERLGTEILPLGAAAGRVLAADVAASRDQPPQPLSAMDGYAMRREDAEAGAILQVIGDSPAGAPFGGAVTPGTAVRIATGGVVPAGATLVLIQEHVERSGGTIRLRCGAGAADFVRSAGSDFRTGEVVAEAGEMLTPALVGLVAAANHGRVLVARRPRLAILASGDELREPGSTLGAGDVANSASFVLAGLAEQWGATAIRLPILSDDLETARAKLKGIDRDVDLIVALGGASVGERDRLKPLFSELGARLVFEKVTVQPGKPTWHARFPGGPAVLGLPGNPGSAFVCAHLFLKPLLARLSGKRGAQLPLRPARVTHAVAGGGERENFLRARVRIDAEGRLLVTADPRQDSGLQSPLASANALLRRPVRCGPSPPGELVEVAIIGQVD